MCYIENFHTISLGEKLWTQILKIQQKLLLFTSAKKQKKLSWFTG